MEHLGPALDQNEEIALVDPARAVLDHDPRSRVDHAANLARDPPCQQDEVMVLARKILRIEPVFLIRIARLWHQRPEIDPPRHVMVKGDMAHRAADPALHPFIEGEIDHPQDRIGRAEGMLEFQRLERHSDGTVLRGEVTPHAVERLEIGPLEGIDRLFLVAHDEDRAGDVARALTGREFLRKAFDHAPLHRARILRLVDEDMIDSAIEAVEHPGRDIPVRKQRGAAVDQVVEIEPSMPGLVLPVARQEGGGEGVKRRHASGRGERLAPRARPFHAAHQALEGGHVRRTDPGAEALRRNTPHFRGEWPGLGRGAVEQPGFEGAKRVEARRRDVEAGKRLRQLAIVHASAPEQGDQRRKKVRLATGEDLGQERGFVESGRKPEGFCCAPGRERCGESVTVPADFIAQRPEIGIRGQPGGGIQNLHIRPGGDLVDDPVAKLARGAPVEFGEIGRHLRLDRKAAQKPGAEGMDGLDPEPARRVDRAREKLPRAPQQRRGDTALDPEPAEFAAQIGLRQHRPVAEPREQTVLHLGRRRLGIGEAENALRFGAGQEKARDAVDQDAGLARPGIGRQPYRPRRVRRLDLPPARLVAHQPTSSGTGGSLISHSPARARWS